MHLVCESVKRMKRLAWGPILFLAACAHTRERPALESYLARNPDVSEARRQLLRISKFRISITTVDDFKFLVEERYGGSPSKSVFREGPVEKFGADGFGFVFLHGVLNGIDWSASGGESEMWWALPKGHKPRRR